MLKIRLRKVGRKKAPFFHVVVGEARTRTSKIIEKIGYYDPRLKTDVREKKMTIDLEKVKEWKRNGAQPTEIVEKFIRMKDESIYGAPIKYEKKYPIIKKKEKKK